ncbi:MAG: hypothetical protein LQ346_003803 [Caloplaca aetnensis]|nr:MAG: hypothetical protein LQ346_003803 [Caloplaca aetnensis]
MPDPFNKGTVEPENLPKPQRNHFTRTHDGKLKLTQHDGVEKYMADNVHNKGIEEMKHNMYEYEGKPALWGSLMSPEQRAVDFDALAEDYRRSEDCAKMVQLVEGSVSRAKGLVIKSCILAGLGSFNSSPRARLQLVAFEVTLETLRRKFGIEKVLIQDPAMDQLDEEFVRGRGYTILKHPEAQNAIDETTFLFCPCVPWVTIWEFLVVGRPCLFYGPRQEDLEKMMEMQGGGWSVGGTKEDKWNEEFLKFKDGRKSMEIALAEAHRWPRNEFVWLDRGSG